MRTKTFIDGVIIGVLLACVVMLCYYGQGIAETKTVLTKCNLLFREEYGKPLEYFCTEGCNKLDKWVDMTYYEVGSPSPKGYVIPAELLATVNKTA